MPHGSALDLRWGSHVCMLYRTSEDLLSFQIPFFCEALRTNQAAIWFLDEPLLKEEAEMRLGREIPQFQDCCACGQFELLEGSARYRSPQEFDPKRLAHFWADRETACRQAGYEGLRISGNVNQRGSFQTWAQLMEYEQHTDAYLHERKMMSLCCYREDVLGPAELADIISAHQGCLLKRDDRWVLVPNHEYRRAEAQTERFFTICQEMYGIASLSDGRWIALNNTMKRMLGYDEETLPPFPMLPLVHPDTQLSSLEAGARILKGECVSGFEQLVKRRNGELIWISWNTFCDPLENLVYCSGRDTTADKAAKESVTKRLEEAERVNTLKDEFLAIISHELRTPLNAILGWAQMLTRYSPTAEQLKNGHAAIMRNARAQAQLIEDLLDMSRMISGRLRLELEAVSVEDVVMAAVEAIQPAISGKRLSLLTSIAPAAVVRADRARLQQILSNLLSNAVKFTPEGGQIGIRTKVVGSHVKISVTDNGEGISAEFLPYLFERFSQRDTSTTRTHKGLGLGLSISRRLAEMHEGTLEASSEGEGKGATFTITIPLLPDRADKERVSKENIVTSEPLPEKSLEGLVVLIVDDETDAVEVVAAMLLLHGAEVYTATSAREALRLVREKRPSVMLTDISMPEEDGYALLAQVRALPESEGGNTTAIALTAFARDIDRRRCREAGFAAHLSKPIEEVKLASALRPYMRQIGHLRF